MFKDGFIQEFYNQQIVNKKIQLKVKFVFKSDPDQTFFLQDMKSIINFQTSTFHVNYKTFDESGPDLTQFDLEI